MVADVPHLVFCFPYRGVGGVPHLFLRVGEYLAEEYGLDVSLVDYADGFMAKNRRSDLTRLLVYDDKVDLPVPEDSMLILQSMTPWSIYPRLQIPRATLMLYWNCYPFNLIPPFPGMRNLMHGSVRFGRLALATVLRVYREKMLRLINLLLEKNSLVFMDSANVKTTRDYLGVQIDEPMFLPVAGGKVPEKTDRKSRNIDKDGLRIAWIGRICAFKYYILRHSLQELEKVSAKLQTSFFVQIVGTGDYALRLRKDVKKLKQNTISFVEHIPPRNLMISLATK